MSARAGGLFGLAFIVLSFAQFPFLPDQPPPAATGAELLAYFTEYGNGAGVAGILFALACLCLLGLVAALSARWQEVAPDGLVPAMWTGAGLLAFGWTMASAVSAGMGLATAQLNEETMVVANLVYGAAAGAGVMGNTVLLLVVAVLGARAAEPGWLRTLAVVAAVAQLSSLATFVSTSTAVFSVVYVAFSLFAAWVIAISIRLLRSPVAATVTASSRTSSAVGASGTA